MRYFLFIAFATTFVLWPRGMAERPVDAKKRVPWTTSRLTGSPEAPPPYKTERVFPRLKFDNPVTITRAPGSKRFFVAELNGVYRSFANDPDVAEAEPFLDLSKHPGHYRTYGLVFHPQFEKNRFAYVCYVDKGKNPKGSRVSRFEVSAADPPRADPKSEKIILEWPSGGHNGGCLQFGPDGCLYIATGDGTDPNPPDTLLTGQDISDLLASILRIDVDKAPPGKTYAIPADNPFLKTPNARPEIWAYGFRNPWKMAFDPVRGDLWVGDVGWEMWEMIYRVERGGNYGWSVVEGPQPVRNEARPGPTPILPPTAAHDHTESRSITGGRVYHGKRLKDLTGTYIYGDYVTGKLWALRHDGTKAEKPRHIADSAIEVIDFIDDDQGELYIMDYGGGLYRLIPDEAAAANKNFPTKLSETGLFASVKDHIPAAGVVAYSINAEPWADHAHAERLFAVPGVGTLGLYEKQNLQVGHVKGAWIYPTDTVFAKTLSLEMERGNPASRRRLETQVLHQDRGTWRAYNFIWNDEQTDAILAGAEGFDRTYAIKAGKGTTEAQRHREGTEGKEKESKGEVRQTWHFASRTECLICHTTRAGSILGFNVSQLNRGSQIASLAQVGFFEKPLPNPMPRLPDPWDTSESLDRRARAYLHTNCAHCHRRGGGGTAPFELLYELDLKKTFVVGSRPTQGTFDIHAAENVTPGDPYRSVLYYRMAKLGPGHMPYAGSSELDVRGLDLVHEWIRQLPPASSPAPKRPFSVTDDQQAAYKLLCSSETSDKTSGSIERLLSSTSGAIYLARGFETGALPAPLKPIVLQEVKKHPSSTIRDLFERFLPQDERVKRLGNIIKPAEILALKGDAARGQAVFFKNSGAQCKNCHRIGKEGQEVGPDLTQIGKKYGRAQILESILDPSKTIEPAYVTQLVETSRGGVHTGLLVKKTDAEITLKDAQGKLILIPARDVELLAPQRKSLMPELLLRDMTAQEVADLLEFLAERR